MKRFELKVYDPFPLELGQSRTVDDFVFSFEKVSKVNTNSINNSKNQCIIHCFCVTDTKTKERRESQLHLGWGINDDANIDFMKAMLNLRKRYNRHNTLYAFQMVKPGVRYGWEQNTTLSGTSNSHYLTVNCVPTGEAWLATDDDFMVRLSDTLTKDNAEWRKERREARKSGLLKKGELNSLEDIIRTKELMNILPLLADVESAIAILLSKGDNYTKSQAQGVSDSFAKFSDGTKKMITLKKWGK